MTNELKDPSFTVFSRRPSGEEMPFVVTSAVFGGITVKSG